MALFDKGFTSYLTSGLFADMVLVVGGTEYLVHRIIISYSSVLFAKKLQELDNLAFGLPSLSSQNVPTSQQQKRRSESLTKMLVVPMDFPDPDGVFPMVLQYMYEGDVAISEKNAIPLLSLANYLAIEDLKQRVAEYITTQITRKNAFFILHKALEFETEDVINQCIVVIARNFNYFISDSNSSNSNNNNNNNNNNNSDHSSHSQSFPFKSLPPQIMLSILNHVSLAVNNEFIVYTCVVDFIQRKVMDGDELSPSIRTNLFKTVRFPYLTFKELEEVCKNPLVPKELVAEGLLIRLGNFECPDSATLQKRKWNVSLTKRVGCGRLFEYTSDFDDRGVLFYIATDAFAKPWSNPALPTFDRPVPPIKVTASSIEKGSPSDIVEIKPSECWTRDVPSSWFAIDLGRNRTLIPTHYTLRHGGNNSKDCLRNWCLQTSDDGIEWDTLSRHTSQALIHSNFGTHSWAITGCTSAHRFFRILQTGHNSTNKNFLSLSGIEFYGELYETK
eukprot:TRINITY_DN3229_c1_g1_i1.p1 TRINITY_DN3229_c1_g1~~TRINITY_DN3229_c1_g1_i1.p1  ORF type:complete len:503 (-),score=104.54 TRINITY_DN3229_c1_g1_i1:213-1721(-)